MRQKHVNTFTGVIDTDTNPLFLAEGNYLDALDVVDGEGAEAGIKRVVPGSIWRVYPNAGLGAFTCIGMKEDKQGGTVIIFLRSATLGNDVIIRYFPETDIFYELVKGAGLGFSKEGKIQAEIVDGRYLYWVDGYELAGTIAGNEPRCLDMERARVGTRSLTYEIYAGLPGQGQFANAAQYVPRLRTHSGTTTGIATITSDGTYENDPAAGLAWLRTQILAAPGFEGLLIENCDGCKLVVTVVDPLIRFEITSSPSPSDLAYAPINNYVRTIGLAANSHLYAWKREPPPCAPTPNYISVPGYFNNVKDGCFQFRSRYVYADNSKSAWSAISVVALNIDPLGNPQENLNAIRVDYSDARLMTAEWLGEIRFVELAVRDGNDALWRAFKNIPACEFGTKNKQYVDFLNDKTYSVVASDDISQATDSTQVLKLFDSIPRKAMAVALASDGGGDTRLFLGGGFEGYDCPDCVSLDTTPANYYDECFVSISGRVVMSEGLPAPGYGGMSLGGFVVYLAGTDFWAISDNPHASTGITGTGNFVIRNVPRGVYSLRVASYYTVFGNANGPRHNLSNGREWQKTSAPVQNCAGSLAATGARGERTIDTRSHGAGIFNLLTEPGYGTITITNILAGDAFVQGYCLDNNGLYLSVPERTGAIGCERQTVFVFANSAAPVQVGTVVADHNGYFFLKWSAGVSGGVVPGGVSCQWQNSVSDAWTDSLDRGQWKDIFDNTAPAHGPSPPAFASPHINEATWFLFNTSPAWTSRARATVSGRVLDADGKGVGNALVWYTRNGRPQRTNLFGDWAMHIYKENGDAVSPPGRTDDFFYANYESDICYTYAISPYFQLPSFSPFVLGGATASQPFTLPNFVSTMRGGALPPVAGTIFSPRYVKAGGIYKLGIVYEDAAGRSCGVVPGATVKIPFHTEGSFGFDKRVWVFYIDSVPPTWATRYRIVRTRDGFYRDYDQILVPEVKHATIQQGSLVPTFTTYAAGNASHLFLRVKAPIPLTATSNPLLVLYGETATDSYSAKVGDFCRYMLDEEGEPFFADRILDVPILGEYVDGDAYYVVVKYVTVFKELKPNSVVEFYTKKTIDDDIYYETGVCLPILDPGLSTRRHKGITEDQVIGIQAASGPILSGDTYWRFDLFDLFGGGQKGLALEHSKIRETDDANCEDIGRAWVVDPSAGEVFHYNRIRYSGLYIPSTKINNARSFGALDYQHVNRAFGHIRFMGMVHTTMLVCCQWKSQPVYVGKNQLLDMSGASSVGRSDSVMAVANETVGDFGTHHPLSIVVEDGRCYGWDAYRGIVWRFGQDGMGEITQGLVGKFQQTGQERWRIPRHEDHVCAGFDRRRNLYMLSFAQTDYTDAVYGAWSVAGATYAFSTSANGWKTRLSFLPDCYARSGVLLFTAKNYTFNEHNIEPIHANFYGVQSLPEIKFAVNPSPGMVKDWWNIRVDSTPVWFSPEITIPLSGNYQKGMRSRLVAAQWRRIEGMNVADFLRDMNDPVTGFSNDTQRIVGGRRLKGTVLIVTLRGVTAWSYIIPDAETYYPAKLTAAFTDWTPSAET